MSKVSPAAGSSIRSPADGATAANGAAGNVNVDATNNGAEIMHTMLCDFDARGAGEDSDEEGEECDIFFWIFWPLLYFAALASFPIGIWMLFRARDSESAITTNDGGRSGYFFSSYRSGYICGTEPPTQEELVARSAVPMCLNLTINAENRTGYGDYVSNRPLCLQAGALDEPAVWCTESELRLRPIFLWWSPCNKCGTAWRIFDEQDNDKSFFKRPTFPQPSSSAVPLEDGWLEWDWAYASWKNTTSISISECSSGDGGYSFGAEDDTYTIPPACYSDTIYTGNNPVTVAGLALLVFGCCFFLLVMGIICLGKYLYFS